MNSSYLLTAVVSALLLLSACSGQEEDGVNVDWEAGFAVVNVTLIPMDEPGTIPEQTILIEGGRIVWIGSSSEAEIPSNFHRIDGEGLYLMPGLTDMHIHIYNEQELTPYLPYGITTVLSNHGTPEHLEIRDRISSGELLAPRMFTAGPTVNTVGISTAEEARELVKDQKAAGYDFIKMYGQLDREAYHALARTSHEEGIHLGGHAPRNLPFTAVLEEGQDSLAHMEEILYTDERITAAISPYRENNNLENLPDLRPLLAEHIKELAKQVKASGIVIVPTLSGYEMIWRQTTDEYFELLKHPAMAYIDPIKRIEWQPENNGYRQSLNNIPNWDVQLHRSLELQLLMLKEFHDAGVPICAGTDATLPVNFPGAGLHRELELYIEAGLSPYEALRTATVEPARMLGEEERFGTVSVGLAADLLLLSANPLDDISNTRSIVGVFAAGRWLPREHLEAMLTDLSKDYSERYAELEGIYNSLLEQGPKEAIALLNESDIDDQNVRDFFERSINRLGYRLLSEEKFDDAIAAFKVNTEAFSRSANTWDSLAEAYLTMGDNETAKRYYYKALEVDPDFQNAQRMLERIEEEQAQSTKEK